MFAKEKKQKKKKRKKEMEYELDGLTNNSLYYIILLNFNRRWFEVQSNGKLLIWVCSYPLKEVEEEEDEDLNSDTYI